MSRNVVKKTTRQPSFSPAGMSRREWMSRAAGGGAILAAGTRARGEAATPGNSAARRQAQAPVQLSMCLSNNPRTRPILDGSIRADGIEFDAITLSVPEMFYRQLEFAEFDISEMSCSSLFIAIGNGDTRFVALPIFTSRRFYHTGILVRRDRGIERPEDLKGKRVGVPEYQQTAALWVRGVLEHEFGVRARDMDWHMERTEELSHGAATGFRPPEGVSFQYIPEDKSIGSMLAGGELDAALVYFGGGGGFLDRSTVDLANHPEVRPLFPDAVAEGVRYYRKTGFHPINHCVVVKREIVEANPWVPLRVFEAFVEAKDLVNRQSIDSAAVYFNLGFVPDEYRQALDADPYPYGGGTNRNILEAMTRFSYEQDLTPRMLSLDEVFHPDTLEL